MADRPEPPINAPFVSTGALPPRDAVEALVHEAHRRFRSDTDGALSDVYPALERVDPDLFGLTLVDVDGWSVDVGDAAVGFPIMSVMKPFVFAMACEAQGVDTVRDHIGVNATGRPFDSVEAVEADPSGRTNPMVNPGAIATIAMASGDTTDQRWGWLYDGLCRFAGRRLEIDDEVYASSVQSNHHNRELASALAARGRLHLTADEAVGLYTRVCALRVTAHDLAVMAATLGDGGLHPVTGDQVVGPAAARATLAVMATAGLYETSGQWIVDVGLPGKSGIGGGIITVSPGKGGLGCFAPLLDEAGNSVKGALSARFLSRQLGLDLFAYEPAHDRLTPSGDR
ncbi:MAG: glutaminase A [Acidimicrobiales bacterium]